MVFFTRVLFGLNRRNKPNRNDIGFWKKRQILKMCQHFYGRSRNCFSLAIRRLEKSLKYVSVGRKLRKAYMVGMWEERIDAACRELGHMPEGSATMFESLSRQHMQLNRQTISNLAIWEPRTFESLNKIAAVKANEDKLARRLGPFPRGILGKL